MPAILEPARSGRIAPRRILLLPPAYGGPGDFVREGFADAVRARAIDLDLVLIELRLKTVTDRAVLDEVREHGAAARAAGCETVWLGGISLGAYIALACAERFARELDGLCLIAPYLGSHLVTGEIERAGGVAQWEPGGPSGDDDEERRIWGFIKRHARGRLPIHLGLGRDDRFAARHRLVAAALAAESVDLVPGGHEWPVWRRLWENFLDARFATPPV